MNLMKVKCDHRSKFSNLSNWKEEAWKNQGSTGFEPMTSAIPVRCSTIWAMKPHIGSKVNLSRFFFFFSGFFLNWRIYCDDHTSLSSTTAVQIWIISYIFHIFHCTRRYELDKLTLLPMCGFIAQLVVEHSTGIAERKWRWRYLSSLVGDSQISLI